MAAEPGQLEIEPRREWMECWLSPSRASSYLGVCDGDVGRALELHEWNLLLGQALMGDIAHSELALRNAYDRVLAEGFEGEGHWLFDGNSPVTRPILRKSKAKKLRDVNMVNRRAVDDASRRAHDPLDPNQVIAGLMLGFWVHMTDRSRERDLWIPYLHRAWPAGTDRADLNLKLEAINRLRNSAAGTGAFPVHLVSVADSDHEDEQLAIVYVANCPVIADAVAPVSREVSRQSLSDASRVFQGGDAVHFLDYAFDDGLVELV